MIATITKRDEVEFYELGRIINEKFNILYNLSNLLNSKYDYVYGYYEENKLIAFIHINKLYEVIDIINIVVSRNHRHKNIATELINYIIKEFPDSNKLMLEVNENNIPAINLYNKNGFINIHERTNYYGKDTAIIMERVIK